MAFHVLEYELVDDYVERRAPVRAEHLQLLEDAHRRGELVMAGALTDDSNRALLVFDVEDTGVIERLAEVDPYVVHGVVHRWTVRPWNVVVGGAPAGS